MCFQFVLYLHELVNSLISASNKNNSADTINERIIIVRTNNRTYKNRIEIIIRTIIVH